MLQFQGNLLLSELKWQPYRPDGVWSLSVYVETNDSRGANSIVMSPNEPRAWINGVKSEEKEKQTYMNVPGSH